MAVIFRYKDGRIIPIKIDEEQTTNKYMNDKIRNSINKNTTNQEAEKLSELEYQKLCKEFEDSLTKKEKEIIESYTIGGGVTQLNQEWFDTWKQTYRFIDEASEKGYKDVKLSDREMFNIENYDERALDIVTEDSKGKYLTRDSVVRSSYNRIKSLKQDVKDIDNIFDKKGISLDKDIIVYRKGHESIDDINRGFTRTGYTSTSAKSRINKKTPGGMMLGNNEFEIIVPAGMKILPIENIARGDVKKQHEILLPRNIQYQLITDKSNNGETRYLVRAKQIKKDKF